MKKYVLLLAIVVMVLPLYSQQKAEEVKSEKAAQKKEWVEPEPTEADRYTGVIKDAIDCHIHGGPGRSKMEHLDHLIRVMDARGVKQSVLLCNKNNHFHLFYIFP